MAEREKGARFTRDARRQEHSKVTDGQRDVVGGARQSGFTDGDAAVGGFIEAHHQLPEPDGTRAGDDAKVATAGVPRNTTRPGGCAGKRSRKR